MDLMSSGALQGLGDLNSFLKLGEIPREPLRDQIGEDIFHNQYVSIVVGMRNYDGLRNNVYSGSYN